MSPRSRSGPATWTWAGITIRNADVFEFAFENYTALGYGDALPIDGSRLLGPIMALNGLLLIGWSVAIIFEVMRMAEVQVGRDDKAPVDVEHALAANHGARQEETPCFAPSPPSTASARKMPSRCWRAPTR